MVGANVLQMGTAYVKNWVRFVRYQNGYYDIIKGDVGLNVKHTPDGFVHSSRDRLLAESLGEYDVKKS